MYAVIGGSGFAKFAELEKVRRQVVRTPFGDPSCAISIGELDGVPLAFLARHGYGHRLAPHEINYRANIWALQELQIEGIFAVASVGGIRTDLKPGDLMVPDQLIDYTHGRRNTFFDSTEQIARHVDFTHPYDEKLRKALIGSAAKGSVALHVGGVYGCTQGPRLETAAEVRRLARDGCDVVGMSGMPEAVLARELEIPYAALAVIANHAAGIGQSAQGISIDAMGPVLDQAMIQVRRILSGAVRL